MRSPLAFLFCLLGLVISQQSGSQELPRACVRVDWAPWRSCKAGCSYARL